MSTTQQLTATPRNNAGTAITGKTATWSSSNTAVATVSTSGLVTAQAAGQATITATIDGVAGTSTAVVTSPSAPSYSINQGSINTGGTSIQQNTSATSVLQITRFGGFTGSITVTAPTGLSGLTVTVGSSEGSLGSSVTLANGVNEFFVRVAVASNAPVGTQAVSIPSTGTGGVVSNHIMQVNVTATPSFSVDGSLSPTSFNVARGGAAATATLTIIRNGGYTGPVALSLFGGTLQGAFPFDNPGTLSFSPSVIPAGQTTSTVSLTLPSNWTSGPVSGSQFVQIRLTPETGDPRTVTATFNVTN